MKPFFLTLLLGIFSLSLHAQTGLIDQPQTFPWSVGLTPVVQEESGGLAPGTLRLRSSVLWFNTYRQYGVDEGMTQRVDMEGLLPTVSAAWSPVSGWELRAQVQGWVLGGGIMDPLLAGFHGLFFLPDQGRDLVSDGGYRDFLRGVFDERTPGAGLTQASLGVRSFSGSWSWTAWVKPPLPGPVDWAWTNRWTGGVGVGWGDSWMWRDPGILIGAGVSAAAIEAQNEPVFAGSGGATVQLGFYGTAMLSGGLRALLQGTWTRVPRGGEGYLSQGAGLLTSGIQIPVERSWTLELALTEEFLTWATMEVGLQAGMVWSP